MIMDMQTLLSDRQAVTTGTQLSTNALDLWNGNTVATATVPLQNFTAQGRRAAVRRHRARFRRRHLGAGGHQLHRRHLAAVEAGGR